MKCFLLVVVLACVWTCTQAVADVLQKLSSTKLNVHLVPHSHDDPGWLKTADQYYSGSNSSIYRASVNYIFNSVVDELRKDRERKFTFCEISFFSRWWHEQDEIMKTSIREMIKSGQLGFVNGGWVMHDEASAHYVSMIDQTTMGHQFLLKELNYRPRVGWQIDPFGHSNTHAWLSSEVGFDALFFGRIDYQDRALRKQQRALEFVWRGSKSQSDAEVFTGAFSDGNYAPPDGFCMDTNCPYCRDDPVVTDPLLSTYNLDYKMQKFIDGIIAEQNISRGNNIMLRMGADFVYQNAQAWYRSIDALIEHINAKDQRFNLFYSDPTSYMRARSMESEVVWPSKVDDFFPYSDTAHAFWAGYFTSRPNLKFLERVSSSYLQVLKQIAATPGLVMDGLHQSIAKLTAAVGLINHHDAVTGTSKQHVADDYKKILSAALTDAEETVSRAVGRLHPAVGSAKAESRFTVCRTVNESVCESTQQLQVGDSAMVLVYNPLPRKDSQQVSVFLSDVVGQSKVGVVVLALGGATNGTQTDGVFLKSDIIPTSSDSPNPSKAPYTLVFNAENIPAMGFASYRVRIMDTSVVRLRKDVHLAKKALKSAPEAATGSDDAITVSNVDLSLQISNGIVSVSFDKKTGLMSSMTRSGKTISISNDLQYYKAFGPHVPGFKHVQDDRDPHLKNIVPNEELAKPSVSFQTSGAYIFRPSEANEVPSRVCDGRTDNCVVELTVVRGSKIVEVHQKFSSWVSQVIRLREGAEAVELEYTVGPIPTDDHIGKEVITRFDTSLISGNGQNLFYTDSNSREFMERKYNYRPTWELEVYEPVSGNYYPTSTSMYIKDEAADVQLSLLTDRSLAAASLANGQMEMMVHRRLLIDDLRGVEEPLNETVGGITPYPTWNRIGDGITITGRQYLLLSPLKDGMKELRVAMDKIFLPFSKFYSKEQEKNEGTAAPLSAAQRLSADLPINAHVVSLEKFGPNQLLLRLAHQFAVEEDAEYSQPVQVDVAKLLASFKPLSLTELTLSANQDKATQQKEKVQWQYTLKSKVIKTDLAARLEGVNDMVVTLNPMQIRTFSVELAH